MTAAALRTLAAAASTLSRTFRVRFAGDPEVTAATLRTLAAAASPLLRKFRVRFAGDGDVRVTGA